MKIRTTTRYKVKQLINSFLNLVHIICIHLELCRFPTYMTYDIYILYLVEKNSPIRSTHIFCIHDM